MNYLIVPLHWHLRRKLVSITSFVSANRVGKTRVGNDYKLYIKHKNGGAAELKFIPYENDMEKFKGSDKSIRWDF